MLPEMHNELDVLQLVVVVQAFALVIACLSVSQVGSEILSSDPSATQPQPVMAPWAWPLLKQMLPLPLQLPLLPPLGVVEEPPLPPPELPLDPPPELPLDPPLSPLPAQEADNAIAPLRARAVTVKPTRTLRNFRAFMSPSRLVSWSFNNRTAQDGKAT